MSSAAGSGQPKSKRWVAIFAVFVIVGGCTALVFHLRSSRTQTKKVPGKEAAVELVHLDTFVVNLIDSEHSFLRIGIDLGVVPEKEASGEEKSKSPEISIARDAILSRLSTTSSAELTTIDGRQKLKSDLLAALNVRAPHLQVREIYITEFLIQR